MSEDYAKGFKDGFALGLEEGKKLNEKSYTDGLIDGMKKTAPPPYNPIPQWPLPGWPSYITCDAVRGDGGAVGSSIGYSYGVGANGPVGSVSQPSIEEERKELHNNNRVWINGQWAELGG